MGSIASKSMTTYTLLTSLVLYLVDSPSSGCFASRNSMIQVPNVNHLIVATLEDYAGNSSLASFSC